MTSNDGYVDDEKGYRNGYQNGGYSEMQQEVGQKSFRQKFREYPKSVFFIFGNECCERFSYYGMKTVLTFYALNILNFSDTNAVSLMSGFSSLCYYTPILGCILADGYIGKFHTIMWVSLLYASGNIILAIASMKDNVHPWLDIIGLVIIGFGTGGIKPCVMSFGGDQFKKGQEKWLEQFFSIFYFTINLGSTVSTILSPMFRVIPCMGKSSCYPLAFGLPAILMVIAVALYAFGSFWYKKNKPTGNVFGKVARVIIRALKNKTRFDIQREHWLYHYMDDHMCSHDEECKAAGKCSKDQFVKDMRSVIKVLVMFIPMPFFWCLYDQNSSVWLIQGAAMDGKLGTWNLLPDQLQTVNPILIMIFIPIFTYGVYPLMGLCFKVTPLRKMSIGGMLAAGSYLAMAFIQYLVDPTLPVVPAAGQTRIEFVNYAKCGLNVSLTRSGEIQPFQIVQPDEAYKYEKISAGDYTYMIAPGSNCTTEKYKDVTGSLHTDEQNAYYIVVVPTGNDQMTLKAVASIGSLSKATVGEGEFVMNYNFFEPFDYANVTVNVCKMNGTWDSESSRCLYKSSDIGSYFPMSFNASTLDSGSAYNIIGPDTWHVRLQYNDKGDENDLLDIYYGNFTIHEQGAIYTLSLFGAASIQDVKDLKGQIKWHTLAAPNSVSIAWQLIPWLIISIAEIFLSITGYEFSYTQAPASMKSIILAGWLLAIAVGDDLIIAFTQAQLWNELAYQYFFFAGLMFVVMCGFILLSVFYYDYVYHINEEETSEPEKKPIDEDKTY